VISSYFCSIFTCVFIYLFFTTIHAHATCDVTTVARWRRQCVICVWQSLIATWAAGANFTELWAVCSQFIRSFVCSKHAAHSQYAGIFFSEVVLRDEVICVRCFAMLLLVWWLKMVMTSQRAYSTRTLAQLSLRFNSVITAYYKSINLRKRTYYK